MAKETTMAKRFMGGGSRSLLPQYLVQMKRRWYFQVLIRLFLISLMGVAHTFCKLHY